MPTFAAYGREGKKLLEQKDSIAAPFALGEHFKALPSQVVNVNQTEPQFFLRLYRQVSTVCQGVGKKLQSEIKPPMERARQELSKTGPIVPNRQG